LRPANNKSLAAIFIGRGVVVVPLPAVQIPLICGVEFVVFRYPDLLTNQLI